MLCGGIYLSRLLPSFWASTVFTPNCRAMTLRLLPVMLLAESRHILAIKLSRRFVLFLHFLLCCQECAEYLVSGTRCTNQVRKEAPVGRVWQCQYSSYASIPHHLHGTPQLLCPQTSMLVPHKCEHIVSGKLWI